MWLALNKYKIRTKNKMGGAPSGKEVQITALLDQVQILKDYNLKLTKTMKSINTRKSKIKNNDTKKKPSNKKKRSISNKDR